MREKVMNLALLCIVSVCLIIYCYIVAGDTSCCKLYSRLFPSGINILYEEFVRSSYPHSTLSFSDVKDLFTHLGWKDNEHRVFRQVKFCGVFALHVVYGAFISFSTIIIISASFPFLFFKMMGNEAQSLTILCWCTHSFTHLYTVHIYNTHWIMFIYGFSQLVLYVRIPWPTERLTKTSVGSWAWMTFSMEWLPWTPRPTMGKGQPRSDADVFLG